MLLDQMIGQVFLYNMGKVASIAIHNGLTSEGLPVHHFHNLEEGYLEYVKGRTNIIHFTVEKMHKNALRRKLFDEGYGPYVKLIVPFRDPVARWVSLMHFSLHHVPSTYNGTRKKKSADHVIERINSVVPLVLDSVSVDYSTLVAEMKRLRGVYGDAENEETRSLRNIIDAKLSVCWFDTELKYHTGINILEGTKFPDNAATYPYKNALFVKSEKLHTEEATDDIRRFVQLGKLNISYANKGDDHGDKVVYDQVKKMKFQREFLDIFYKSPWIKHLYGAKEIEAFYARWAA